MTNIEETIRKHVDAFNRHDVDAWASQYGQNAIVKDPFYAEPLKGRNSTAQDIRDLWRAFPDAHIDVGPLLASDKSFALECTMRGTHEGPLELPSGGKIDPTNRRFQLSVGVFGDLDPDGNITEEHRYFDVDALMNQLGISTDDRTSSTAPNIPG